MCLGIQDAQRWCFKGTKTIISAGIHCDQPYFLIVVWTWRRSPTHLHHPSMFPFAWRNFHHNPALVAPIILWLEYFLCAHHTIFPNFQLPGTHADPPRPAFLPTWPFTACTPFCAPQHPSSHLCTSFPTPLCTSVHLCASPHTSTHPCATFCTSLSRASHPYWTFQLTLDPSATWGNSALVQLGTMPILGPLWNQVQTLQPPYSLSIFSVGLHNPHSHPRTLSSWVTIAKVALLFIAVSPAAGLHTLYYHSMAHGWLIPILSGHTFLCNPWRPMRAQP